MIEELEMLLKRGDDITARLDALIERTKLSEEELEDLQRWQDEQAQKRAERAELEASYEVFLARTRTLGDSREMYEKARLEKEAQRTKRNEAMDRELARHVKGEER